MADTPEMQAFEITSGRCAAPKWRPMTPAVWFRSHFRGSLPSRPILPLVVERIISTRSFAGEMPDAAIASPSASRAACSAGVYPARPCSAASLRSRARSIGQTGVPSCHGAGAVAWARTAAMFSCVPNPSDEMMQSGPHQTVTSRPIAFSICGRIRDRAAAVCPGCRGTPASNCPRRRLRRLWRCESCTRNGFWPPRWRCSGFR